MKIPISSTPITLVSENDVEKVSFQKPFLYEGLYPTGWCAFAQWFELTDLMEDTSSELQSFKVALGILSPERIQFRLLGSYIDVIAVYSSFSVKLNVNIFYYSLYSTNSETSISELKKALRDHVTYAVYTTDSTADEGVILASIGTLNGRLINFWVGNK